MSHIPHIPPDATAGQALALLEAAGWREVGAGDWSWVLSDPSGVLAARVTPFDPAYRLHAQAVLDGPPNRWLPRIDTVLPLAGDGYVVIMERLWPAPEDAAAAFCAALGVRNESGYQLDETLAFPQADADLAALRARVLALSAEGSRRWRLWGGSDVRPGNVMADAQARLKLVDPLFLRGLAVVEAITEGRVEDLGDFRRDQLEAFLTIPPFKPGPETDALRRKLSALAI